MEGTISNIKIIKNYFINKIINLFKFNPINIIYNHFIVPV